MPHVRIRTARERKKAIAHLTELRSQGKVARALVIIERPDGNYEVLGQEMVPLEVPRLLAAAAMAYEHADGQRRSHAPERHELPLSWGEHSNPGDRIRPKITRDAQGVLVPPPTETLISCAACHHPRFYVCVGVPGGPAADLPVRIACAHCENEVSWSRDDFEPKG